MTVECQFGIHHNCTDRLLRHRDEASLGLSSLYVPCQVLCSLALFLESTPRTPADENRGDLGSIWCKCVTENSSGNGCLFGDAILEVLDVVIEASCPLQSHDNAIHQHEVSIIMQARWMASLRGDAIFLCVACLH